MCLGLWRNENLEASCLNLKAAMNLRINKAQYYCYEARIDLDDR